jgi:alanine racemase
MKFPRAVLSAAALANNLDIVRRFAPHSRVIAVVKANAYGHGLLHVVRALSAADAFGVARLEEALALRAAGVLHPLVLLEGVVDAADLLVAAEHRLDIVVHSLEQVRMLERFSGAHRFAVWLKLDSGMHRLGLSPAGFATARERLQACEAVGTVRVMSHFAAADLPDDPMTHAQIAVCNAAMSGVEGERSFANSAAIVAWPQTHCEWVRPGLMLYGISPLQDASAAAFGLQPVMTLTSALVAVRTVQAGETVGYGPEWRATRRSLIGVAAIGYGDGYPRALPNGTPVLVNGRSAKLAGRVSMDMIAVDLTEVGGAQVGDEVVLWGAGLPVEQIARLAGTIGYELVCRVTQRVHADWVDV